MLDGLGIPGGQSLGDELVDRDAVLRVHHNQRAGPRRLLHCAQDLAIGRVEDPRVCHEHLEAVHPGVNAGSHLLQSRVVDV